MDAAPASLDLTGAPFRVAANADPAQVAAEMQACFATISRLPAKVSTAYALAVSAAGVDATLPLVAAGRQVAADIDAGIGAGTDNPYHNAQHFSEVILGALCLSHLQNLAAHERALLLFAALMHDFHHDGRVVRNSPFRLERQALESAAPYLERESVDDVERERLAALVLATDVVHGVPYARKCHRHFSLGDPLPEPPPDSGALARLGGDARLALLAVLLTEADVLASVGLTIALGDASQARISSEMGLNLGSGDKLAFLEKVFGHFEVSRFFEPNLEAMKREMAGRAPRRN